MAEQGGKSEHAFRTIGELAAELGVPQHILRYWETRFPQLKPLQRAGNRRYYRPSDVALAHRIHRLLNHEGYTIRGVQQLLKNGGADSAGGDGNQRAISPAPAIAPPQRSERSDIPAEKLRSLRELLVSALEESEEV